MLHLSGKIAGLLPHHMIDGDLEVGQILEVMVAKVNESKSQVKLVITYD